MTARNSECLSIGSFSLSVPIIALRRSVGFTSAGSLSTTSVARAWLYPDLLSSST
nr:MAG TPA: hypothetical protein [Caudoviricetes sp.]